VNMALNKVAEKPEREFQQISTASPPQLVRHILPDLKIEVEREASWFAVEGR